MNKVSAISYRSVYWVKLGKTVGSEIYKTRPCIVISNNWQNTLGKRVVIIPLTTTPIPKILFTFPLNLMAKKLKFYQNKSALLIKNE